MLFSSYEFIFLFLPITLIIYFWLGKKSGARMPIYWLVAASLFFYGYWDVRYVPLLLASIAFNFFMARQINGAARKKPFLIFGIMANLLLLGYFKYTGFFIENVNLLTGAHNAIPEIVLPLGISFFTFTQTAYLVDTYRAETDGCSFSDYCLFVTIFPHLIAGPIIYHKSMLPQFRESKNFRINYENLGRGILLFVMGFFKKTAIADTLSPWVGEIFSHADSVTFIEAWLGAIGYSYQLYFDFSGYSEMAIGLGLMLNLKFPTNFNSPYQAVSIIDFWRRWHMTLGSWVKNYLYIPLGGSRLGEFRKTVNLLAAMLLVGLWHGAGWTFVVWGGLHGIYLVINHQWNRLNLHMPNSISKVLTFFCVVVAWVIFRADSIADAEKIIFAMFNFSNIALPFGGWYEAHLQFLKAYGVKFFAIYEEFSSSIAETIILSLILWNITNPCNIAFTMKPSLKYALLGAALFILGIILLGINGAGEFLYFQF